MAVGCGGYGVLASLSREISFLDGGAPDFPRLRAATSPKQQNPVADMSFLSLFFQF